MAWEAKYAVERPNLLVGFLAFFGCVFLISLRAAWFMSFHLFFQALAALLNVRIPLPFGHSIRPFAALANAVLALDNSMMHWIGVGIDRTGHAFIESLLWVAYTLTMIGVALAAITYEILLGLKVLHRKTSTSFVQQQAKPAIKAATLPVPRVKVIADSRVPALAREITATNARIDALEHAIALPAPITVPRTVPKVGELGHAWDWTRARIGKLSKLGTIAGLIGLTAAVLGRLGLGWVKCSNVGKAGRQVCGMNPSLLESLLADTLLIAGTVSLVEFARGMQGITEEIEGPIRAFWRAT